MESQQPASGPELWAALTEEALDAERLYCAVNYPVPTEGDTSTMTLGGEK